MALENLTPSQKMSLSPRILVVDDDAETTNLLRAFLETNSYEVVACNSGVEAVEIARSWLPDVILLDLVMPDLDGFEVCQEVRAFSDVPILVLSAIGNPDLLEKTLTMGADDYLNKPVKSDLLLVHLNRLVRRALAGNGHRMLNGSRRV